jgi:hypothetical protein
MFGSNPSIGDVCDLPAPSTFPNLDMQHTKMRIVLILVEKVEAMRVVKGVC